MSENKCPCCGDTISIFPDSGFYECDSCPFMCALEDFPRIAAAMKAEASHNALVEAVAWERECCQDIRPLVAWAGLYVLHGEDYVDAVAEALREIQDAARAEVDRLIADCKGEE